MHELSITRNVVAICAEHARGKKVTQVTLAIGELSAVLPDSLRFCFDVCARGTPLEGATLNIIMVPGRARCRDCGEELALPSLVGARCACGGSRLDLIGGEDLRIREMEVA